MKDLVDYLEENRRREPERTFLSFEGETYTCAQVMRLVEERAQALRLDGYGSEGKHLVIDERNSPRFVITLLAAFSCHIPVVLLNSRLTATEKAERLGTLPEAFPEDAAVVIFTSGTTGASKAVPLSQENLIGAAEASCHVLCRPHEGIWQLALPLYHVSGLGVLVRAIVNDSALILYALYDAAALLRDAKITGATHISVVDKMLRDMLSIDSHITAAYEAVLLGGGPLNEETLARCKAVHASIYASFGMTETSGCMAASLVTDEFDGSLALLAGYEAEVLYPDAQGAGELAVRGPGVTRGYLIAPDRESDDEVSRIRADIPGYTAKLSTHECFAPGRFFLTGDKAIVEGNRIRVSERLRDMFISGGENVYPAQVEAQLRRAPGIADAVVFGTPDRTWGRVPIAFITESKPGSLDLDAVHASLRARLSGFERPRDIFVVGQLPTTVIGKVDRRAVEQMYRERIEVVSVTLHRIRQPLNRPFATARGILLTRSSMIVEVCDACGNDGYGEDVAFETDWYLTETQQMDREALETVLIPRVLSWSYLKPDEAYADLRAAVDSAVASGTLPAGTYDMAIAAIENALWDLYGRVTGKTMAELIGADPNRPSEAGMVVGIGSAEATVASARAAVEAGFSRVKFKIAPDDDLARIQAVRAAFPELLITLDANRSFLPEQVGLLEALAPCHITGIEEPFALPEGIDAGPADAEARLAFLERMQERLSIPIAVDESVTCAADAQRLLAHEGLRMAVVKIGRMGGVKPTLDFIVAARARGIALWMGGMYDTSISKRLHAAFGQLPGVTLPGDIAPAVRYFAADIVRPPLEVENGEVLPPVLPGLGFVLDDEALAPVEEGVQTFRRAGIGDGA